MSDGGNSGAGADDGFVVHGLGGSVELIARDGLPNDGKVIDDQRGVD